jgi:hypothetical protein
MKKQRPSKIPIPGMTMISTNNSSIVIGEETKTSKVPTSPKAIIVIIPRIM